MEIITEKTLKAIAEVIQTVHRLRAPNGCPWDQAQTHQSLRPYVIEEAYEVLDVLDKVNSVEDLKTPQINQALREELGDLFLQILLHSEMASETGAFSLQEVATDLNSKLIRRHPHVFGDVKVDSTDGVLKNWEEQKLREKAEKKPNSVASVFDGMPRHLPALQKTSRIIERVTKVGFQWPDAKGPLDKLKEEVAELEAEINDPKGVNLALIEDEIGDLLFSVANVSSFFKIQPEDALRKMLGRFEMRFRHIEIGLAKIGKSTKDSSLEEMDTLWNEAKKLEKKKKWVIGITGGIGSGKSAVVSLLKAKGYPVLDADQLSRDLMKPGSPIEAQIKQAFGTTDRSQIRELIFQDKQARLKLEAITHPEIKKATSDWITQTSGEVLFYEASLLFETGRYRDFDGCLLVTAPEELRRTRVLARETSKGQSINSQTIDAIMSAQMQDSEKKRFANWQLENSGSEGQLATEVEKWLSELKTTFLLSKK